MTLALLVLVAGCDDRGKKASAPAAKQPAAALEPAKAEPATKPPPAKAEPVTERPPAKAEPAAPVAKLSGYAIVASGTPLRTSPDPAAPSVAMPAEPTPKLPGPLPPPPRGALVKVVGTEGDFLAIELVTPAPPEDHCSALLPIARELRLRLFVPRDALLPVTTRELEIEGAAGTRVTIAPGVPLFAHAPDKFIVEDMGIRMVVPVPDDARGLTYEPRARASDSVEVGPGRVPEAATVSFDGVELQGWRLMGGMIRKTAADEGTDLVTVQARCLLVRAHTTTPPDPTLDSSSPAMEEALAALIADSPILGPATPPRYEVRMGAPAYWEDHRVAGEVTGAVLFETEARVVGAHRCIDHELAPRGDRLTVCFDPADIAEMEPEPALPPVVVPTPPPPSGKLDKESIRKVVRSNIEAIRECYNRGLARNPTLAGRVAVRFTISATGEVAETAIASDTISSAEVSKCVLDVSKTWTFPAPAGGGNAVVTYPFVFEPG